MVCVRPGHTLKAVMVWPHLGCVPSGRVTWRKGTQCMTVDADSWITIMLWTQPLQSQCCQLYAWFVYLLHMYSLIFRTSSLSSACMLIQNRGVSVSLGTKLVHLVQTHCLQHIIKLDTRAIGIRSNCNQQSLLTVDIKGSPPAQRLLHNMTVFDWFWKWGQTYLIRIWSTFLQYLSMFCARCKVSGTSYLF